MDVFLLVSTVTSVVVLGAGRDESGMGSSDARGFGRGMLVLTSRGVTGSDSVGVDGPELGTEVGIVIGGGGVRDVIEKVLALAGVRLTVTIHCGVEHLPWKQLLGGEGVAQQRG